MAIRARVLAPLFAAAFILLFATQGFSASGPAGVVSGSEIGAAVASRTGSEAAARTTITNFLDRPEVVRVADRAGLDIGRARATASTLTGSALQRVAAQVNLANSALASDTVVISTTTIIIILLVIILLVLIL